jgi:hypothetical protein
MGYVDYERIYGVEGVGLANTVSNAQEVEGRNAVKKLKTYITFDDGSNWSLVPAPSEDSEGRKVSCNTANKDKCSLHLHSVTTPRNYGRVFSSPAPGLVMGVGSIGENLLSYAECDTFLSTDAGLTWRMVKMNAHKHQIGGVGSVLVVVNDEDGVDEISYSLDFGKNWLVVPTLVSIYYCIRSYYGFNRKTYKLGLKLRARGLTTLPDSTSLKMMLLGEVARKDRTGDMGRVAVVQLDFANVLPKKCGDSDFDKWYARSAGAECLMGHKVNVRFDVIRMRC